MSIFSLDWFKSKKSKKLEELKIEEQMLKNELLRKQLVPEQKYYHKLKLVNDVLTVVLLNGEMLSKAGCTADDFDKVRNATSEYMVISLFKNGVNIEEVQKEVEKQKVIEAIVSNIDVLKRNPDFVVEENSVKLKGIDRTIPQLLVEKFIYIISKYQKNTDEDPDDTLFKDDEYISLKRFFMWCCLNPRAEVANELYRFLMENSFRITRQGFFVALRNVVSLEATHGDNLKIQFISNAYNKIKAVWKKNPENFDLWHNNGEFKIIDMTRGKAPSDDNVGWERLGNLKELYLDLPNMAENRFTDDWTKTFDIRIGQVVSMPMEKCNWSTQDCAAAGLHFTADQIHYVGCGDTSVLMLINPMKVVGIGQHKGRCYEYLPIMTVPREEATKILHDLDFDTIELDEFYVEDQLENLAEKAKEGFSVETKKHQFNLPQMSSTEINKIVKSLNKIKNDIGKRVQEVV